MPYKSGLFQAALGAITAVAFLISNSFGNNSPAGKRSVGTFQRTGSHTFQLTNPNGACQTFQISDPIQIYLNDKPVTFEQIENGRTASVRYVKKSRVCFATFIDLFPTHLDS